MKIKSKIITANAGSGKTYQIVERVKEIVLNGYCPSSVLCITFTKVGQKEMEERLFEALPKNTKKPKVVTFHALCSEILSLFTKEINMPMEFSLMDGDSTPENLLDDIFREILQTENTQNYIQEFKVLPSQFQEKVKILIAKQNTDIDIYTRLGFIEEQFGISFEGSKDMVVKLQEDILFNIPIEELQSLDGKTATEQLPKILEIWQNVQGGQYQEAIFWEYINAVLAIRGSKDSLVSCKDFILQTLVQILNVVEFRKSYILGKIAMDIPPIVEKYKKLYKQYTFDDLIDKTLHILQNEELSHFALFTIAEKIQHLIVDEAQDTNRKQWAIISPIVEEFQSRAMEDCSVFIVGDPKQTIYGFQGSEENMMAEIHQRYPFLHQEFLQKSYRSTQPVLNVINSMARYFGMDEHSTHISAFAENTGMVQVISSTKSYKDEEDTDELRDISQKTVAVVQNLLTQNLTHPKYQGQKIMPKHIAILVKNRPNAKLALALREACQKARIHIAFNEKIDTKQYYAVLDFICLVKLCVIKQDLQNIYAILKSPIFAKLEEEFHHLFHKNATEDEILHNIYVKYPDFQNTMDEYQHLLLQNGITNFFLHILTKHQHKYSTTEQKVLQAFIQKTDSFNQFAFVEFIQNFESSKGILVSQEIAENAVTLTTIHNSKGLEFPVVIFLDATTKDKPDNEPILFTMQKIPIVRHKLPITDGNLKKIRDTSKLQEILQQSKDEAELPRLHYVAISRTAEQFFYICTQKKAEPDASFYKYITDGMQSLGCEVEEFDGFLHITYGNLIQTLKGEEFQPVIFTTKNLDVMPDVGGQSWEAKFGTLVHLLFENINKKLIEAEYLQYLTEEVHFENILSKVQNFDKKINTMLEPITILRECEFIFNKKVIRLDALYFHEDSLSIIDYKTQRKGLTEEIVTQLMEYRLAVKEVYKRPVRCFIAWFNEEELEEVIQ